MFKKPSFIILLIILATISLFTLGFKMLSVPPGIETDEGSIALNSALISQNLRDQNNRFLPFFILSSDRMDWKQPVLIYLGAIFFKLFGTSLLIFKMVNLITALSSLVLIYYLVKYIFNDQRLGLLGALIAITTPIIIITSRIGNESIQPLFYSSLWLLSLVLYKKFDKNIYLFASALALGIGMYCFKGMRIIVPVWFLLTLFYIFIKFLKLNGIEKLINQKNNLQISFRKSLALLGKTFFDKKLLKSFAVFTISFLPFILIIPILEQKYPGSVFDRQHIPLESYRHYFNYWFLNLDLSFFFTKVDVGKIYETKTFGPFLLALVPFFITGVIKSLKKLDFNFFVLICFIFTPILFGVAKSSDYIHRLVGIVPFFIIIVISGFIEIKKYLISQYKFGGLKKFQSVILSIFLLLFSLINYLNFVNFYYFEYPKLESTNRAFGIKNNQAFIILSKESKQRKLVPYIQDDIYGRDGDGNRFFNVAYLNNSLKMWKLGEDLPIDSILLTEVEKIDGFKNINAPIYPLNILIKDK